MKARDMALCALFSALIAVCAWISIPAAEIAFTMQTFGMALTLGLLGGKRGTIAISVYILLGITGLPVFSGFRGGLGVLLGATGGYIAGFLIFGLLYWLITAILGTCPGVRLFALSLGLLGCYLFGSVWFYTAYLQSGNLLGFGSIFAKCVLPYVLPDALKLTLAFLLTGKLKRFVY